MSSELVASIAAVEAEVAEACRAAGRERAEVTLIAVSKTHPADAVAAARRAGLCDFGENYAQELREKALAVGDVTGLRWHFIGSLQRNKVKYVVGLCEWLHTIDSPALLDEVARVAAKRGVVQRCLVEVNVGHDPHKSGIAPSALPALLDAFAEQASVRCEGLMTIPPFGDAKAARPHFRALRALRDEHRASARPHVTLRELSMGMSADFAAAIAEGATMVRVGTAIFGARPTRG